MFLLILIPPLFAENTQLVSWKLSAPSTLAKPQEDPGKQELLHSRAQVLLRMGQALSSHSPTRQRKPEGEVKERVSRRRETLGQVCIGLWSSKGYGNVNCSPWYGGKNDRQMYIVPKYPVSKDVDWNLPYEVNLECADFEILHSVSMGQSNGDEWNYKIMSRAFCRKSINFPSPTSSEIIS